MHPYPAAFFTAVETIVALYSHCNTHNNILLKFFHFHPEHFSVTTQKNKLKRTKTRNLQIKMPRSVVRRARELSLTGASTTTGSGNPLGERLP
jgi:hypothetical protein